MVFHLRRLGRRDLEPVRCVRVIVRITVGRRDQCPDACLLQTV
jgi:hypothetical protein